MTTKSASDVQAVERGVDALRQGAPISHRGHAWKLLCIALPQTKYRTGLYNDAINAYELEIGHLLLTRAECEQAREKIRVKAYRMTAEEVRAHIERIPAADPLFWECWRLFKDDCMWTRALFTKDFATHFTPREKND